MRASGVDVHERGFAFVEVRAEDEAAAVAALEGAEVFGQRLCRVARATAKPAKNGKARGGRRAKEEEKTVEQEEASGAASVTSAAAWPLRSPVPITDVGINLTNRRFRGDLGQVLRRAGEAGVRRLVVTGTSGPASAAAERLLRERAALAAEAGVRLYSTAGVHPHDASSYDDAVEAGLERLLALPGVVAVGETGLDYNRMHSPREVQVEAFRRQVALAVRLGKPIFVHEREAHEDLLAVLRPHHDRGELPPVVVHCFTGTEPEMREYVRLGFYVGLTTFLCKRARGAAVRDMLRAGALPLGRLLLETDGPFMLPDLPEALKPLAQFRRRRNEPCTLPLAVQEAARCLGVGEDEVARATDANSRAFFGIE